MKTWLKVLIVGTLPAVAVLAADGEVPPATQPAGQPATQPAAQVANAPSTQPLAQSDGALVIPDGTHPGDPQPQHEPMYLAGMRQ